MQNKVYIEPESHRYFDDTGREYTSVSRVIASICKEFDAKMMAPMVAKKRDRVSKETAALLKISQEDVLLSYPMHERGITGAQVLKEWDAKRDSSIARGNRIHNAMEKYSKTLKIDSENKEMEPLIKDISKIFLSYQKTHEEAILYSEKYGIAGTADKILLRNKKPTGVIDIGDYKTNESKGIQFCSNYNDFLFEPLTHLEDCNYIRYSLQLSIYAVMLQEMFGCSIGKLFLIFIPAVTPMRHEIIPVPYMKFEAIALMEHFSKLNNNSVQEIALNKENKENIPTWD